MADAGGPVAGAVDVLVGGPDRAVAGIELDTGVVALPRALVIGLSGEDQEGGIHRPRWGAARPPGHVRRNELAARGLHVRHADRAAASDLDRRDVRRDAGPRIDYSLLDLVGAA